MEPNKSNTKATFAIDAMAELFQKALDRWKAKSPKAARIATDALFWTGTGAVLLSMVAPPIPGWMLGAAFIVGSALTKLTKE